MLANRDISLSNTVDATPYGDVAFTVSCTVGGQDAPEQAYNFVAIAHHRETGVMTMGHSTSGERGKDAYRTACANAGCDLYLTVMALIKYRQKFEVQRYAN
ncbi:hypothetical protein ACQKO6_17975 [Pseudomonas monteilii]